MKKQEMVFGLAKVCAKKIIALRNNSEMKQAEKIDRFHTLTKNFLALSASYQQETGLELYWSEDKKGNALVSITPTRKSTYYAI